MVMENFLQNVICELAEPSLLVDREKRVVFATKSFETLIGKLPDDDKCRCTQHFVVPSLSDGTTKDACCWDVLDIYLHKGKSALWPLTRRDGSLLSTRCTVSPIQIGNVTSLIAIFVRPLLGSPAKSSLDFFQAASRNLGTQGSYEDWVSSYLKKHLAIKQVIWLDAGLAATATNGNSLMEQLIEAATTTQRKVSAGIPFDVVVRTGRGYDIFHLFPSTQVQLGKILAIQAKGQLNEPTVHELLAAVAVTVTRPASDQANWIRTSIQEAFSVRENQILAFVVAGIPDKEIASRLNLSPHTVRNHVRHMMGKAGATKRIQLVAHGS